MINIDTNKQKNLQILTLPRKGKKTEINDFYNLVLNSSNRHSSYYTDTHCKWHSKAVQPKKWPKEHEMSRDSHCWRPTRFVRESEGHHLVGNAADIPHRGDAAVIRVVLRSEVLQLQDLRFPLQEQEKALGRAWSRGARRAAGCTWDDFQEV